MRVLWKPRFPLTAFLMAETDAERVFVAMIQKGAKINVYASAPEEIYQEARKVGDGTEQAERVAKALMDADLKCDIHTRATRDGCAECLGLIGIGLGPNVVESAGPTEEPPWVGKDDIPF